MAARSPSAHWADSLVRDDIARYLAGPAFSWFLERDRTGGARGDKAAPVALLPEAVRLRLGATAGVLEMTDRVAARQRRRRIPAARYADIQQLVDDTAPERRRGEWVFEADGWRLAVRVRGGVARVAAFAAAG